MALQTSQARGSKGAPSSSSSDLLARLRWSAVGESAAADSDPRAARRTWTLALLGAALMYAAFPPLSLSPLAWIAPVPWLLLAREPRLSGRRPYVVLWLAGFLFWFGLLHWLRLPHPATSLGWFALSFYLAFYTPLFVGLLRIAVRRVGIPLIVAAPIIWMGLGLAQAHVLTGFTMGCLAHTQYRWIELIQISDLAGETLVSAVIVFAASCLTTMLPWHGERWRIWPLLPLAAVMAAVLGYGTWRTRGDYTTPGLRVALIQGSIDAEFKADPGLVRRAFDQYLELSRAAMRATPRPQLVVWPETMYRYGLLEFAPDAKLPPNSEFTKEDRVADRLAAVAGLQRVLKVPLLLGGERYYFPKNEADIQLYNSAIMVGGDARVAGIYDKMHPVMFGEYIPFAGWFPLLYKITPLTGGLAAGTEPKAFDVAGLRLAPNICYESVIPHLIRNQVATLRAAGREPDVLVNVTNDGWFWGSSELELHLMCGVFRAVECRKPLLIAANTGISAWIDGDGRVLAQGPRRDTDVVIADVRRDSRSSVYLAIGDIISGACLTACFGLALLGFWDRRRAKRQPLQSEPAPLSD